MPFKKTNFQIFGKSGHVQTPDTVYWNKLGVSFFRITSNLYPYVPNTNINTI